MRFLRNRFVSKFLAVLFLLLILESTVHATVSYALTTGPHQPEYISYEEPGATDMVNLLTGDFSFSLPILDVPGPDGGFSVPLTYNAGIGLEQEASWVGLGWTLNVGAITRSIVQYPDDASGEVQSVTRRDLDRVRGWTSSALGFGQIGWNNVQGHYGSLSLIGLAKYSYDNKGSIEGGVAGFNFDANGFNFSVAEFALAAFTIATWGTSGTAAASGNIATQAAISIGIGAGLSFVSPSQSPNSPVDGAWAYNRRTVEQGFLHKNYWIWLDETRNESMLGVLNLNNGNLLYSTTATQIGNGGRIGLQVNGVTSPTIATYGLNTTSGNASDVNYYLKENLAYKDANTALSLATDNYSVKAPGLSGSIKPYRLDIGSVAMPHQMSIYYGRWAPLPYQQYKVPFIYEGSNSNSYFYHAGATPGSPVNLPEFYYGLSNSTSDDVLTYKLDDDIFQNRIRPDLAGAKKIPMANHIEWLTNAEISSTPSNFSSGYMDYFSGSDRTQKSTVTTLFGVESRPTAIGGYAITGTNGVTYHFALASYEYQNYTRIESPTNPTTKYSEVKRDKPFANTWLLTGITGSDFVDRGGVSNSPNGTIDVNDWGYWVKFNYGKFSDGYKWSIPFSGTVIDAANTSQSITNGYKQLYYLNSIETRSHVALFLKNSRFDNMSVNGVGTLRLNEIDLISRESYQKLFLPLEQGGFAMPSHAGLANIGKFWLVNDFFSETSSIHPPQGEFIIKNALKRVKFSHSYDLCPGANNSTSANKGKLTLTRVALLGRNESKLVPDYKFEYGENPSYDKDKWDGWGMYAPAGTSSYNTHKANDQGGVGGEAWSLSRITNPLGSMLEIRYQRDQYASVSGYEFYGPEVSYSADCPNYNCQVLRPLDPEYFVDAGGTVKISGTVKYTCNGSVERTADYSGTYKAETLRDGVIRLNRSFRTMSINPPCPSGSVVILSDNGTIKKRLNKAGGNTRVASLTLKDEGRIIGFSYEYENDDGASSGVVAQEPEYDKAIIDRQFNTLPNYPFTPVMYSRVTVLTHQAGNAPSLALAPINAKEVYEFETPFKDMVTNTGVSDIGYTQVMAITYNTGFWPFDNTTYFNRYTKSVRNEISDYTSKIGKLRSYKLYDPFTLVSSSDLIYSSSANPLVQRNASSNLIENNRQGVYSEGVLLFDQIGEFGGAGNNTHYQFHQNSRTTILKYPCELVKIVKTKDGFTSETENKVWDFISGQVVEKTEKSPLGLRSKTVTKPAFRVPEYSQMGSKAIDINNKNMLGHEAASYTYQVDAAGNNIGLLSASVQTWKSNWGNYRYLNGANYSEGTEGSPDVWRKHQNYVYKGTYANLRADGSLNFTPSQEFSFASGAANTGWQKTGEVTRYDHYSAALEGKDLNNIFSSSKKDISAKQVYANSSNATYHEFAYSGAEDWDASGTGTYFGGEVAKGAGTKVTKTPTGTETHTGQNAVQIGAAGKAFIYKPASLTNGRVYRVSAWTNSLAGAIYYSLNGGAEQTIFPVSTMKVGSWYQINVEIPVGTFSSLEVGVKSTSGTVSFDDFRFQPRDGSLTANVYDPVTGAVTFVLDNQNMFTQYEYNDRGQLVKTYSESFLYGVKLVSENKINYKRFNTNQ